MSKGKQRRHSRKLNALRSALAEEAASWSLYRDCTRPPNYECVVSELRNYALAEIRQLTAESGPGSALADPSAITCPRHEAPPWAHHMSGIDVAIVGRSGPPHVAHERARWEYVRDRMRAGELRDTQIAFADLLMSREDARGLWLAQHLAGKAQPLDPPALRWWERDGRVAVALVGAALHSPFSYASISQRSFRQLALSVAGVVDVTLSMAENVGGLRTEPANVLHVQAIGDVTPEAIREALEVSLPATLFLTVGVLPPGPIDRPRQQPRRSHGVQVVSEGREPDIDRRINARGWTSKGSPPRHPRHVIEGKLACDYAKVEELEQLINATAFDVLTQAPQAVTYTGEGIGMLSDAIQRVLSRSL